MNETLIKKINLKINNELLDEALTHRSFLNELKDNVRKNNERLEFIGDAVLELVVTDFLFNKYPEKQEGVLTSYRSALVKTESLAEEARRLEIGKYLKMSKGEEMTGGRDRTYLLANTIEAIIGAIYLSSGFEEAKKFILLNICYKIEKIEANEEYIDAKSKLQELSQEQRKITPIYELETSTGPDHDKIFEVAVRIGENIFGRGSGKSKQEAQQNAAKVALDNWDELTSKYFAK